MCVSILPLRAAPAPSFDASLNLSHYPSVVKNTERLNFFRALYEKNNPDNVIPSSTPRIPRVIHHIWLGSPLPTAYAHLRRTWMVQHPTWHHILWTDTAANYDQGILLPIEDVVHAVEKAAVGVSFVVDVNSWNFANRTFYEHAKNYGERSDILRYAILENYGGLYVDTDCECFKSFDFLHYCYDFYTGLLPLDTHHLQAGVAVIGACAHHPILISCVASIPHAQHLKQTVLKTGPFYFTRILHVLAAQDEREQSGRINIVFPPTYFYPCAYTQRGTDKKEWLCPESLCTHHWDGAWLKKEAFVS